MLTLARSSAIGCSRVSCEVHGVAHSPRRASVRVRALPIELLAAAGDVEAPLGVPIIAAVVVTAAVTFAVPAYLSRGQQAADKIFASKERAPLDKGRGAKGKAATGKGKTAPKRR